MTPVPVCGDRVGPHVCNLPAGHGGTHQQRDDDGLTVPRTTRWRKPT